MRGIVTFRYILIPFLLSVWVSGGCGGTNSLSSESSASPPPVEEDKGDADKQLDTIADSLAEKNSDKGQEADNEPSKPVSLEKYCETAPCRKNLRVDLLKADGTRFDRTFPLMAPAVQNRLITVFAGETILVEATASQGGPTDYLVVDKVVHPERTLSFKLEQLNKDGKVLMMLNSKNPFSRDIRLHLSMMLLSNDKIAKTSSCPVSAGLQTFEIWPDAIFQILITDIVFLDPSDDYSCVE